MLHVPGPLERCWRQFAALRGDCKKSRIAPLNAIIIIIKCGHSGKEVTMCKRGHSGKEVIMCVSVDTLVKRSLCVSVDTLVKRSLCV